MSDVFIQLFIQTGPTGVIGVIVIAPNILCRRTVQYQRNPFLLSQAFGMCHNVVLHGLLEQCLDVPGKDVALKAAYVAVKSQ